MSSMRWFVALLSFILTVGFSLPARAENVQTQSVSSGPPVVQLTLWRGNAPEANESLLFIARAYDPDGGEIASYNFNFGDGSTISGSAFRRIHKYSAGNYTATVSVTDDEGDVSSASVGVGVADDQSPQRLSAMADANRLDAFLGTGIIFQGTDWPRVRDNTSQGGGVRSYQWDFGDGTTADTSSAMHAYSSPGTYIASFTVTDHDGENATGTITVRVHGGTANSNWFDLLPRFEETVHGDLLTIDLEKVGPGVPSTWQVLYVSPAMGRRSDPSFLADGVSPGEFNGPVHDWNSSGPNSFVVESTRDPIGDTLFYHIIIEVRNGSRVEHEKVIVSVKHAG